MADIEFVAGLSPRPSFVTPCTMNACRQPVCHVRHLCKPSLCPRYAPYVHTAPTLTEALAMVARDWWRTRVVDWL